MKYFMIFIAVIISICILMFISEWQTNIQWKEDCEKMGSHLYGNTVYDCNLRESK